MNSNLIREGELYAWYQGRPRGVTPLDAAMVRANSVSKHTGWGAKNRRSTVNITVVQEAKGWPMNVFKVGRNMSVPAREIIDFWDSYKDETDVLVAERQARERTYQVAQAKAEIRTTFLDVKLAEKGIPRGSASFYGSTMSLPMDIVLAWIGVTEEEMEQAISNMFGSASSDGVPSFLDLSDNRDSD